MDLRLASHGIASIPWAALGLGIASIPWAAFGIASIPWIAFGIPSCSLTTSSGFLHEALRAQR